MPLPKKEEKTEETETITVSDDEEVQIKGPYENKEHPEWGRTIRIETRGFGTFVGESNLLVDISKAELKSFKDEKDILKNVVKDMSKLKEWTKNFEKGKGGRVDMGPTNEILTNILECLRSLQKNTTSLALIVKRLEKKKGD